jgi:membrane fusion protein (multidrug efflux system)
MSPQRHVFHLRNLPYAAGGIPALLSLVACSSQSAAQPARPPVEVGVVTLHSQPVHLQTELTGRTAPYLISDVRPQVTGIIKARLFKEGSLVKAGDVLYEIDPAPYIAARDQAQATLESAQAALEAARLKSERYDELLKIQGVSQQEADDARTAFKQVLASISLDRAALQAARINLGYTHVRAPITGRIGISSTTPGALVTAGQASTMATIRALNPIYVDVTQSSAALLRLRHLIKEGGVQEASTEVALTLEDGSTYPLKGRLQFAEVAVDQATGSVTIRAEFPNPDGTLLPGMYVRAVLEEAVDPQGVLAPQPGISHDQQGHAIALVVGGSGKVEQRAVETRRAIGDQWLISTGLHAGDRLVVQGLNKVRAGDTVRAVEIGWDGTVSDKMASNSSSPDTTAR